MSDDVDVVAPELHDMLHDVGFAWTYEERAAICVTVAKWLRTWEGACMGPVDIAETLEEKWADL